MFVNGKKLAYLRNQRGYTQAKIADMLDTTVMTVSFWERGNRTPELNKLIMLADIYGVSVDYLLDRTEIPNVYPHVVMLQDGTIALKNPADAGRDLTQGTREELQEFVRRLVREALQEQGGSQHGSQ